MIFTFIMSCMHQVIISVNSMLYSKYNFLILFHYNLYSKYSLILNNNFYYLNYLSYLLFKFRLLSFN